MNKTFLHNSEYEKYKNLFTGYRFPLAFVDLDQFDENMVYVAALMEQTGKTIRIASKSIRCLELIKRIFEQGGNAYRGVLFFTLVDAVFLIYNVIDDIFVAFVFIKHIEFD
ncbi:MAG: hypothetical protein KJN80_07810, partial [Deltaproteobacteria bacterium]|nr:hypothetical protein [Deltaproteobacteria bacterium]